MIRLGVNVDHIATLRQARRGERPDPVEAALLCERSGAQSIVCHLREDRRHIQDQDVQRLKRTIATRLNLEMSMARGIVNAALRITPAQVTLVPERRQELTTEGGLDVVRLSAALRPIIQAFQRRKIDVSLFIDPVPDHLEAAARLGARIVELHTGCYANARAQAAKGRALRTLERAARQGRALGLVVAAGHGLDYENIRDVVEISEIEEVNIGFSIVARALWVGLERAVQEMVALLKSGVREQPHAIAAR
ncbi:MAG: pyridoxine 5'-phosphate synthase [Candidatus Omnitrophica bacterium]|nr:pyridoxine 5'-phosphate synthase [Candidatus Omnitrophota bacterium]